MLKPNIVKNLMENIDLQTKLELFTNYSDKPENVDVNWEVLIAAKINKYITATLNTQLLYDWDVYQQDKVQFKEVFGVGFSYKF